MENILPLELWDKIIRYYPLLSLYLVSSHLYQLFNNRYEHLADWLRACNGNYIKSHYISTVTIPKINNSEYQICQIVDNFDHKSITVNDLFSPIQIRYTRNSEGDDYDMDTIVIKNKINEKCVQIIFTCKLTKNDGFNSLKCHLGNISGEEKPDISGVLIFSCDSNFRLDYQTYQTITTNIGRYYKWLEDDVINTQANIPILLGDVYHSFM